MQIKMALDVQRLRLTDDHTLESASEVMSQLGFDQRLPDGQQAYIELLRNLGFQGNQDGEEHTQLVFQGQCLILGDARVGKTSLKKSLIGRPFDTQEPATTGVEVSLVDRKWMELDVDAGLTFGSFARFRQSVVYEGTMYGPGGIKFALNHEITSMMSTLASFTFMLDYFNYLFAYFRHGPFWLRCMFLRYFFAGSFSSICPFGSPRGF